MRRGAILSLIGLSLTGACAALALSLFVSASAQEAGGAWRPTLRFPDGREVQWRSTNAAACDGSDVEVRLVNNSSSAGEAKFSSVTFACAKSGEATGPGRVLGRVPAGGAVSAPAISCACAERGGVADVVKVDLEFLREGSGSEVATNGCSYNGNYANGQRSGKGVYTCPTGYRYEGNYLLGQPNGQGVETLGAQRYEGTFVNGKRHGMGKMTYPDGSTYDGDFRDGLREGAGTAHFKDGSEYIGEWKTDLRVGHGTYTSAGNSWTFDGEWVNDQRTGPGKLSYSDGSQVFEGAFRNGLRVGDGTVAFSDGRVFRGAFVNDQQVGPGTLTFADGRKVTGAFKDYRPHGAAVDAGPVATVDGQWANGLLDGRALLVFTTGERYEGAYANGRRNGVGIETRRDGSKEECTWIDDVKQQPCNKVTADGKRIEFRTPTPKPRN